MRSAFAKTAFLLPAFLGPVVLFVVLPLAVYGPNTDEFRQGSDLAATALWGLAFSCVALSAVILPARGETQGRIVKGFFFLGLFLLLSDIVAPVQVGQLYEGTELAHIPEPARANLYEAVLALALLAAALKLRWSEAARKMAAVFVGIVLIGQAVTLGGILLREESARAEARKTVESKVAETQESAGNDRGNIYHVMFDSYGPGFDRHAEDMGMIDNFDGFTLFADAMTNADYTGLSFPSFMTGTLFTDDTAPLNVWQEKWEKGFGLFGDLSAAGYHITQYMAQWRYKGAATTIEPADLWNNKENNYLFWDMVLLRAVPNAWQQELFKGGRGLISREVEETAALLHGRGAWSRVVSQGLSLFSDDADKAFALTYGNYHNGIDAVALMQRMIADEASRPATGQYVFVHILLPHGPFNIDRDLHVRGVKTSAYEQSLASVRLMNDFIAVLKAQGKYKDAAIVFQGDHGTSKESDAPLERGFKKDVHTLVLVKPAGAAGKPLAISHRPVQLLDIAPTVYAAAGITPPQKLRGLPLFSKDFPRDRVFDIFTFKQPFDDDIQELLHYTYSTSAGWSAQPNILPELDFSLAPRREEGE